MGQLGGFCGLPGGQKEAPGKRMYRNRNFSCLAVTWDQRSAPTVKPSPGPSGWGCTEVRAKSLGGEPRAGSQAPGRTQSRSRPAQPGPACHQGSRSESVSQRHLHGEPCPPPGRGPPRLARLRVPHAQRSPQPQDSTWACFHRKRGRRVKDQDEPKGGPPSARS